MLHEISTPTEVWKPRLQAVLILPLILLLVISSPHIL